MPERPWDAVASEGGCFYSQSTRIASGCSGTALALEGRWVRKRRSAKNGAKAGLGLRVKPYPPTSYIKQSTVVSGCRGGAPTNPMFNRSMVIQYNAMSSC